MMKILNAERSMVNGGTAPQLNIHNSQFTIEESWV